MDTDLVNNQYSLSIRICPDGFSFFIYDENGNIISQKRVKPVNTEKETDPQDIFSGHKEIHPNYKNISVICESDYYTLIPDVFYLPEKERDFLKLQHPSLPESSITFQTAIKSQHGIFIYAINETIVQTIRKIFNSHILFEHHLTHILKKTITENQEKVVVWTRPQHIDIFVFRHSGIALLNSYSFQTIEDIAYHILNIYHQLNLDTENFSLEMYNDENTSHENLLKKYLSKVTFKPKQTEYEDYQWKI